MPNTLRTRALFIVAAAMLAASILTPVAAVGDKEVLVVNSAAQPVPVAVQGVASVSGAVSIIGTPAVHIANYAPVRDLDLDARLAVQAGAEVPIPPNALYASGVIYTVPAGKRLVIEFVSAASVSNTTGSLTLTTVLNGQSVEHHLAFPRADYPRVSETVRIFADQNTDVVGFVVVTAAQALNSHALFTISGYLVDM